MSRDDLAAEYLDQLPYPPYPVQEDALLSWFTHPQGILVCAPTGTGKTLIAEAALFEALKSDQVAYYTTPLIALTEQKFQELQAAAVRWGFSADDVGLVTGNRKVNPDARIRVVVAEILLNRLLHPEHFDFDKTAAVVMDEFHSFNDPERGVVWELSLGMLPKHVRLMLLSATVGNAVEFLGWLNRSHGRQLQLIQSTDRKVPLSFNWVGDELLADHVEWMQTGDEGTRKTPALIFSFNRAECWNVAEQLKGKRLLADGQQKELSDWLDQRDWKIGVGPKLKQLLLRGVGVHHAGMLPKYRRRVEQLFQQKLLSVCLCTETLAAGINLPARSVVLTSLIKGPPGKKKVIDASSAHQIFGRAGRPQFDTEGYVYALAHEDDVRIARWKEQYDQIPEDTKDPNLIRAKKKLKKKMPTRRANQQYWNEEQFQRLIEAPPLKLASRGELPWRLLAHLLEDSPDVTRLQHFVRQRLLDSKELERAQKQLNRMLLTLHVGDFITLEPLPPQDRYHRIRREWEIPEEALAEKAAEIEVATESSSPEEDNFGAGLLPEESETTEEATFEEADSVPSAVPDTSVNAQDANGDEVDETEEPSGGLGTLGALLQDALARAGNDDAQSAQQKTPTEKPAGQGTEPPYEPLSATPTSRLASILDFRTCNPIYASFLLDHLGLANRAERIQALESVLDVPGSLLFQVRAPGPDILPPGPLARYRLDTLLLERGLATANELNPAAAEPEFDNFGKPIRVWPLVLGDKLRRFFESELPGVSALRTAPVWIAGDLLLTFGGNFQKYVTSRDLTKQEGLVFRHLLRLILLCKEFELHCPQGEDAEAWRTELQELSQELTESCRIVDPESTDDWLARNNEDPLLET
ncbi:MAG: DEAD/DEAH box helicase [Planctomycetaceae bacterium]|nr:DEAD/DEAH box helicase [Planctomycetaceae bacterium]